MLWKEMFHTVILMRARQMKCDNILHRKFCTVLASTSVRLCTGVCRHVASRPSVMDAITYISYLHFLRRL